MKHGNGHFLQLTRDLFREPYCWMSNNARWLFVVLNELEQRFTGPNTDFFFRADEDLAKDAGFSIATLKRAKKELLQYTDLVQSWQAHYENPATGKLSTKHVTAYRILK